MGGLVWHRHGRLAWKTQENHIYPFPLLKLIFYLQSKKKRGEQCSGKEENLMSINFKFCVTLLN
jgi:hypothetical protein